VFLLSTAEVLARDSRAAQGLPERVEDEAVLARVAALIADDAFRNERLHVVTPRLTAAELAALRLEDVVPERAQ
jgi:hypothetical protein